MEYRKRYFILLFVICVELFNASAQTKQIAKIEKTDTTKVITTDEVKKISEAFLQRSITLVNEADEKNFVEKQLALIQNIKDDSLKHIACIRLSSTAMMFLGATNNSHIPIIFSAKAANAYPNDALLINNFGAALRMLDSLKAAYKILLYAKKLLPQSPVILTNLGNTCFELSDDRMAETFFKKALLYNNDYALARHGLVSVYLKRKDLRSAMEELFKGIKGIHSSSLASVSEGLKYNKNKEAPPDPGEQSTPDNNNQSSTQNNNSNHEQLKLPNFHQWMDTKAFLEDQSPDKWSKQLKKMSDSDTRFSNAMALTKMKQDEMIKWAEYQKKPGRILNEKSKVAMEMMQEYFDDRLTEANRRYMIADSIAAAKATKAIVEIGDFYNNRIKQKGQQVDANHTENVNAGNAKQVIQQEAENVQTIMSMSDDMAVRCKRMRVVIENYFGEWKKAAKQRHDSYNQLLETYWIYCEQYLNKTYNPTEYKHLNGQRKSFVAMQYSLIVGDYQMRKLAFAAMNMSALASISGDCPEAPKMEHGSSEEEDDDIEAPEGSAPDCPFKNSKGKLGAGVCSLALDCESIELECGEGVIGSGKWNYKKKEFTAFVGVGFKAEFGISQVSKVSLEAKTGLQATFNKDSQLIDAGSKTEVGAKYEYGNWSAGGNVEVTAGATGINVETTKELSYKMF